MSEGEKRPNRYVKREGWGEGPWDSEPDWEVWPSGDYLGFAIRHHHGGGWKGYAAVPPGHCLFGGDANSIEAHQGTNYAGAVGDLLAPPELAAALAPVAHWWAYGFDCEHLFDYAPGRVKSDRELEGKSPELQEIRLEMEEVLKTLPPAEAELYRRLSGKSLECYRTLSYVRKVVEGMIAQFREPS